MLEFEDNLAARSREKQTDIWNAIDNYERYMGRWSRPVADKFIKWLYPESHRRWLDVGCGSGSLTDTILRECNPSEMIAVDLSVAYVNEMQRRHGQRVVCRVGDGATLPVANNSIDFAVSGLVLNFIHDPLHALLEMKRVLGQGGMVAAYVWDYAGTMDMVNRFWDAANYLKPESSMQHEAKRFSEWTDKKLADYFSVAGLADVEVAGIVVETVFNNFDDYWTPFLGGQGPAPTFVANLTEDERQALRELLAEQVQSSSDGLVRMTARAWAAKGRSTG